MDPTRFPNGRRTLTGLMAHRMGCNESALIARPEQPLSPELADRLMQDVTALNQGKPLAYIYGEQPFLEWNFFVDERVLIPRPETEALCDQVRGMLKHKPPHRILDLCTGSGAMGCALALSFPHSQLVMTDISEPALAVARINMERLGLTDRANTAHGDLWDAVNGQPPFDLILSNPPYVAEADTLDASVLDHEPHVALFSEDQGLDHIKRIFHQLEKYLAPGGLAAFELGHHHARLLPPGLPQTHLHIEWGMDPFKVPRYLFCRSPLG